MFDGLMVAMVTPFRNGALDLDACGRLVDYMLDGGVEGLVVSGSTGEAATCSFEERRTLWSFVREHVRGRVPVVAGTGTNNTSESITNTRLAEELGLDGVMLVTPYYNKPTPRGQVEHFTTVAKSTRLPVILYNVPGRTATNTLPDVFEKVQATANIVAVKEASGSLDQAGAIAARTRLTLLSGDDSLTLPMIAVGARGVISVAGNVAPREMRALCDHARGGRAAEALEVHRKLLPLFKALFIESNPAPAKYLLQAMGIAANELRLPLVPVEPASEQAILAAARALGLPLESPGRVATLIPVVLVGASGRMGLAIERAATGATDLRIAGRMDEGGARRIEAPGANPAPAGYTGGEGLAGIVRPGDVVVEFSVPDGFRSAIRVCRERAVPLVSGTTGLGADDERQADQLAEVVPVLRASNFSLGVAVLRRALAAALKGLPDSWDIEIVERHHRGKADSPSGTALTLARDAAAARGWDADVIRCGREGRHGARPAREIGMHSVRGGSWVGDHTVLLAGAGESIELRHVAEDRLAFAHGALAAARFVATAPPGRYGLEDVLTAASKG